jgi:hypothetical protein
MIGFQAKREVVVWGTAVLKPAKICLRQLE